MQKTEFNFTKAALEAIKAPASGRLVLRDTKQPGLQLRVTPNGVKTFSVRRRVKHGPDERVTLGRFPTITVEVARAKASVWVADMANGKSVADVERAARAEQTFGWLFKEYIERHAKLNKRTWAEDETKYEKYLARAIGAKKLSHIERHDLASIHSKLTVGNAEAGIEPQPVTANRVLALISSVFGWAIKNGLWHELNPCMGISRNREQSRDRFLQGHELPRFFASLAYETNGTIRDYVMISLLTGARRANVLAMAWKDLDLGGAEWTIKRTKNGDPQTVTLAPEAVEVLLTRQQAARDDDIKSDFVFPGPGESGHLEEPKKGWRRILDRAQALGFVAAVAKAEGWDAAARDEAELAALANPEETYTAFDRAAKRHNIKAANFALDDLRIHDLRRTLGSWQAKQGASLSVIGKSLNHRNMATTAIYARLDKDPVRESVNRATAAMLTAGGVKKKAEVIDLKKTAA